MYYSLDQLVGIGLYRMEDECYQQRVLIADAVSMTLQIAFCSRQSLDWLRDVFVSSTL